MSICDKLPEWLKLLICREETKAEAIDRLKSEKPEEPCGFEDHWWWLEQGFTCPSCERKFQMETKATMELERDEKLAQLIADKVYERFHPNSPEAVTDRVINLELEAIPSDGCQGCIFEPIDCGWVQEKHPCFRYSREKQSVIWVLKLGKDYGLDSSNSR